jgi:glycopeptide antibiotics resistance protein
MKKRLFPTIIFLVYIVVLIEVMVFKNIPTIRIGHLMLNFGGAESSHPANFVPFATILPYLLGYKGWIIAGVNLIGNIVPLVPLGFLFPFIFWKMTWKKSLILGAVSSLMIEMLQTILHVGIFDIDDVILNILGVMIGYWAFLLLLKWLREKRYMRIVIVAILVIVAAAGALYVVYPWGQPVANSGVGAGGQSDESTVNQGSDLCGGTGGTGEIISKGINAITIKRKDGVVQSINLTAETEIRNSAGSISESDLKIGEHVTVVIYDSETASTVLVCNNNI